MKRPLDVTIVTDELIRASSHIYQDTVGNTRDFYEMNDSRDMLVLRSLQPPYQCCHARRWQEQGRARDEQLASWSAGLAATQQLCPRSRTSGRTAHAYAAAGVRSGATWCAIAHGEKAWLCGPFCGRCSLWGCSTAAEACCRSLALCEHRNNGAQQGAGTAVGVCHVLSLVRR